MNNHKIFLLALLLSLTGLLGQMSAQYVDAQPQYDIHPVKAAFAVSETSRNDVKSILDLNPRFKTSWIKEYLTVDILAVKDGQAVTATGSDLNLTSEQQKLIASADADQAIKVLVKYIPENNLKNNIVRELDFTVHVKPTSMAFYPGGQEAMQAYLQEQAMQYIPAGSFTGYDLTAVKFTIDTDGHVTNAHIFDNGYHVVKSEEVDDLLLRTICNMPEWQPAQYTDGQKAAQDFVFTIGNMENCVVNLLSIK